MKNYQEYLAEICGDLQKCSCGHSHRQSIDHVEIRANALDGMGDYLLHQGCRSAVIVADPITYRVGYEKVEKSLRREGVKFSPVILGNESEQPLVPDTEILGRLLLEVPDDADVMIGVGSGSISDLVRYIAARLNLPFVSVPTAPSMDGYASSVAPLHVGRFKKTFLARAPKAIFADTDIVTKAPQDMIAAGFGDIVGKITARVDWQISHIVTEEYYCETPLRLMSTALNQCLENAEGIGRRDPRLIESLMEALILSGVAIMLTGNSRPASGPEHLLAHYWEVRNGLEGKSDPLHGTKVGVATPIAISFIKTLFAHEFSDFAKNPPPNYVRREKIVKEHYRSAAGGVLKEGTQKWAAADEILRLRKVAERNWRALQKLANQLPEPSTVKEWLKSSGGATSIDEIRVNLDELRDALLYAKEMRARFTVFDLADYLGCLEKIADETLAAVGK